MNNIKELEKKVMDRLTWDNRIDESQIEVSIKDNIATLRGCVSTYPEKILAEIETQFIQEIKSVINNIEIVFPDSYESVEDKDVEKSIFCLLDANTEIDSNDVKVIIKNGNVLLEGNVNSYWKKDKIRRLASQVKGIISVKDKISVIPDENISDKEIADILMTSMQNSVHINANKVNIKVKNGVVTLSGILHSMGAFKAAINIVKSTKGVINIINNLKWVLRYHTT
ncbi:MAG: BON domain-containing protein [Promethearchaeota archaeon]